MKTYVNKVKCATVFKKDISPTDIICPRLMEHFYIIEYAQLIKKCLCGMPSPDSIIGVITDQTIILNENAKKYTLSINRIRKECEDCRYVYICMGQNCKECLDDFLVLIKIFQNLLPNQNCFLFHQNLTRGDHILHK